MSKELSKKEQIFLEESEKLAKDMEKSEPKKSDKKK